MMLAPLTRWWVGQYLFGRGCFAEVTEIDDEDQLKLWIYNGHWGCWYCPRTLRMQYDNGGPRGDHYVETSFQEIVEIEAGRYWPAVDGQHPPWEIEHVPDHHPQPVGRDPASAASRPQRNT